uniref:Uncharacterized protein n=1 Tax=Pararge aegeria TaxID=116150 RepID=S4PKT9_9NEOP
MATIKTYRKTGLKNGWVPYRSVCRSLIIGLQTLSKLLCFGNLRLSQRLASCFYAANRLIFRMIALVMILEQS